MTRGAKCRAIPFLKRARLVRGGWCPQDRLLRERPHPAPHHFSQDPLVSPEGRAAGPGTHGRALGGGQALLPPSSVTSSQLLVLPLRLLPVRGGVGTSDAPSAKDAEDNGPASPPTSLRQAGTPHGASCGAWPRGTPGACPQSFPPPRGGGECHGTAGLVAVCLGAPGACPRVS